MRRLGIVLALGLTMGVLATATPALATFPGTNGRIAFGSDRYGGTHNIFTMNPDGSDVRQLTFLTFAEGAALDESWSPDGSSLVYERRNMDTSIRQIFVMNADGFHQHRLFNDLAYRDFYPSFSPDGTRVVFGRCRPDFEACAIYSVGTDGHGLTAITPFDPAHNVLDFRPEYSPDGQSVAFDSFNRGGVQGAIYVVNADGSHLRRVTPPSLGAFQSDWAPDGSRIAVTARCCTPQHTSIWTVRPDGTGLAQLTSPGSRYDFTTRFSPEGDRIAFERDASDFSTSRIMLMNPDGSGVITIQADAFVPSWGPAG